MYCKYVVPGMLLLLLFDLFVIVLLFLSFSLDTGVLYDTYTVRKTVSAAVSYCKRGHYPVCEIAICTLCVSSARLLVCMVIEQ